MAQKIIRDPVHDVIAFDMARPVDRLLFELVGTIELQRLRRIQQLGLAHLAYPGATHTRYSHSLGVLETSRQMLQHLSRVASIDETQALICLVAALLHDLGHGPFSHMFERVSGIAHERLTVRLILDPQSQVHQVLWQHNRLLPERVAAFLKGEPKDRTFLNDVIASQLDADRFDYLLRDNHMTGSHYGAFDLKWLLHALAVNESAGRLAITWKGISAIEDYLHARYNMYRNVYFHKVVRSAEGMVRLALRRARRLAIQGRLDWPGPEDAVYKALLGQRLTIPEFVDLDDVAATQCLKLWARGADQQLAGLCSGLLYRRLYKTIDLSHLEGGDQWDERQRRASEAVTAAGGDPDYDLFFDEPSDTPYEDWAQDDPLRGGEILVQDSAGGFAPFSQISPLPAALGRRLMFRRIHVAEAYRDAVLKAVN